MILFSRLAIGRIDSNCEIGEDGSSAVDREDLQFSGEAPTARARKTGTNRDRSSNTVRDQGLSSACKSFVTFSHFIQRVAWTRPVRSCPSHLILDIPIRHLCVADCFLSSLLATDPIKARKEKAATPVHLDSSGK